MQTSGLSTESASRTLRDIGVTYSSDSRFKPKRVSSVQDVPETNTRALGSDQTEHVSRRLQYQIFFKFRSRSIAWIARIARNDSLTRLPGHPHQMYHSIQSARSAQVHFVRPPGSGQEREKQRKHFRDSAIGNFRCRPSFREYPVSSHSTRFPVGIGKFGWKSAERAAQRRSRCANVEAGSRCIGAISALAVGGGKPVREMQIAPSQTALNIAIVQRRTPRTRNAPAAKLPPPEILKVSFKFPGHTASSVSARGG